MRWIIMFINGTCQGYLAAYDQSVPDVDVLEAWKMGKCKDLCDLD